MDSLSPHFEYPMLSLQNSAYRIDEDRIVITVERISNHRDIDNLSGTLQLQLCAVRQETFGASETHVLASTTLGELQGQHGLIDCHYDLLFQSPPEGIWQLVLQLSEWNGTEYLICDSADFTVPYQANPPHFSVDTEEVVEAALEPTVEPVLESTVEPVAEPVTHVKKNATGGVDGYLAINKSKVETLLSIKGVPKKTLEKLVKERPFASDKAVLNIKGVGPVMLQKIVTGLITTKRKKQ